MKKRGERSLAPRRDGPAVEVGVVHIELFDHLLLLAAITSAATLVRLLRRGEGVGRGYALVVGVALLCSVLAMGASRFFGVVALALVLLTIVVPWLLEHASRWAFTRGHLVWVGRMSSLRASLMPGSGLARQLPIIDGLSLLERKGVDAALAHYRRLADEAEDPAELAVIHEQIVAMLFHGRRWDEGIAHYERRFHAGYAALRPSLALGLLRAYGEAGRLETAAGLLRALEEGPVGGDPSTAELLGQAQLTFLAYAGAVDPVDEVVRRRRFSALGLTPATAELFKGIALARAGAPTQAAEILAKVEDLAGPRDHRVLEATRAVLEGVRRNLLDRKPATSDAGDADDPDEHEHEHELGPELRSYVESVGLRLRVFLVSAPPARSRERPWASYAVMVALAAIYGVHLLRGGGSVGLLELGALSEELWRAGSWGRVFTAAWIHVDLIALLFDVYAIWLAGQVVERTLGPARMLLATVVAGIAGTAASVLALPLLWSAGLDGLAMVAPINGNLMAVGAITAALWMLAPARSVQLAARARRNLLITLSLLLVANLLTSWPGLVGFGVAPVALLVTVVVASVSVASPLSLRSRWFTGALAGTLILANLAAAIAVLREDPEAHLVDHRTQRCELGEVVIRTPISHTPMTLDRKIAFGLPIVDGLLDSLELRDGGLVQIAVHRGPVGDAPALFGLVEGLAAELTTTAPGALPEPFAELLAHETGERWRAWDLWRNGERVGRVVERRLPTPSGAEPATIMVLASPAAALDHAPAIHAAILREAALEPGASTRPRCST